MSEEPTKASKTRQITVVIPEDSTAEEGDFLEFHVDGQDLSIPVPAGAKPGDAFDIIISEDEGGQIMNEEVNEDDETITIHLFSPEPNDGTVPFTLNTSTILLESESENENENESGEENNKGDETYSVVWPNGVLLAKYLTYLSSSLVSSKTSSSIVIKNKSILELGSGLGVAGLAAAVAGANKVVLTDIPSAIPVLSRNISDVKEKEGSILQNLNPNVEFSVQPLVWGDASANAAQYDVVIGSDLIYDPNCKGGYEALAQSLDGAKQIIMAVRWRKPDLERRFFSIMEETYGYTFDVVTIPIASAEAKKNLMDEGLYLPCSLHWREYGNPDCEASNQYFQSMMINVGGKETVSLAQMTDEQIEKLSDEEFNMFELMQSQIYIGNSKFKEVN